MKKCISILLAMLLVFSLAACSASAKMPSKAVSLSDNKTLNTYITSDSGKKITVNKINSPVPEVWKYWDSNIWNSHYIYPFFDMGDRKLMPVYAMYELHDDYISDGIVLANSPQVRKGSVRSIDVPYTDYDGKTSTTTHYTFTVSNNKITVKGGDRTESVHFDKNGNVTSINSPYLNIQFIYKNNKLSKIDCDANFQKQTINSEGEITYLQTPGVGYACNASYKYDKNGILIECDFNCGGGAIDGGHSLDNVINYQIQNGMLTSATFTGKLDTHQYNEATEEDDEHTYNLKLNEQYIYNN